MIKEFRQAEAPTAGSEASRWFAVPQQDPELRREERGPAQSDGDGLRLCPLSTASPPFAAVVVKELPISLVLSAIPSVFAAAYAVETEDRAVVTVANSLAAVTVDVGLAKSV